MYPIQKINVCNKKILKELKNGNIHMAVFSKFMNTDQNRKHKS